MKKWTEPTSSPFGDIKAFKKKDPMMNGKPPGLIPSLTTIARQVDPDNAAKRIDDMAEALNAFRKADQWILVSPDGQMWAGDTKELLRVLMVKTPLPF